MLDLNQIYNTDCLEGLKQIDSESIDAIISDPPYQLTSTRVYPKDTQINYGSLIKGFMGKEWDVLPSIEILKECHRVLKYGAFSLWLMTPRMDSQVEFVMRLKQAGFNISFTPLYWAYASGFPKSMNIAKAVDKRLGIKPLEIKPASGVGFMNPDNKDWHITKNQIIMPKATSPEAKSLDGSFAGFQPKPAVEVIIVAMKPIKEKTYVDQALLHLKEPEHNQLGGTWLYNGRIPYVNKEDKESARFGNDFNIRNTEYNGGWRSRGSNILASELGRFPANLLVSDEILNNGTKQSIGHNPNIKTTGFGKFGGGTSERVDYKEDTYIKDLGGFSRYFDLDEWYRVNIEDLPKEQQKTMPFLIVPKVSTSERNEGLKEKGTGSNTYNKKCLTCGKWSLKQGLKQGLSNDYTCHCSEPKWEEPSGNKHPTVKPIKLISYLITLATRENDIVLDPFIGSGTTAIASYQLNRKWIGFEKDNEYFNIAEQRLSYYIKQGKLGTE